ncbi:MAG: DNA-directed RNA polymerase [Candidatus Nezhaarchaeota archaeon]|nr:DNA-directed RNA polymerase [Candidatus Nezhaarchaeota archaeon]MCX8141803.1 DNA-directed RNA polymerase [Candidatus Nezhaarchaeota archaeon]MDW8050416.1 DNA-directed RNA polymerase [Nitrososphaerota archaeon]
MYYIATISDEVRIPPNRFGEKLEDVAFDSLRSIYEGIVVKGLGVIVAILQVKVSPEGRIVPGDGATYHKVRFDALIYSPLEGEVIEGDVTEIVDFGAFVRVGPIEGLVHISQIADDYVSYDKKKGELLCKQARRKLSKGDAVRARIVTISMSGVRLNEVKIGLTMRQPFLGKIEWINEELKKEKEVKVKKK